MTSRKYLIKQFEILKYSKFEWYNIPDKPISHTKLLSSRRPFWKKQARVLNLIAQGYSLEAEIRNLLLKNFSNLHKKSIQRATTSLHDAGLIHKITLPITIYPEPGQIRGYKFKYSLVRLTRHGRGLCRRLATQDSRWKPRETQWERMRRLHKKGKQENLNTRWEPSYSLTKPGNEDGVRA